MGNHFQLTIMMFRIMQHFRPMLPSSLHLTPTHHQTFKICSCSFYQRFTQTFVSASDKTVLGFFYVAWQYRKECYKSVLTLQAPATQNGQTHSNYCRRIVEVCLIILWGWRLKNQPIFMPLTSFYTPIKHQKTSV